MSNDEKQAVLILHNPRSGSRHAIDFIRSLESRLRVDGWESESLDSLDRFERRVAELAASGRLRSVIAAGGDGTATAVASRIAPTIPLWLCPLGTENLFARYLGMKYDVEQAPAAIKRLQTRSIDAGLANGRLFLVMLGIGFDAEVVRRVHRRRRGHIRRWHYAWPILKTMFSYPFPAIRLQVSSSREFQQTPTSLEACWFFLLNLPRYASGLDFAPSARADDGLLDVCSFRRGGLLRGLTYLWHLRRKTHSTLPDFSHFRGSRFIIEASHKNPFPVSFQLDGDWGGYLPLEVESLPGRLRVIEPIEE